MPHVLAVACPNCRKEAKFEFAEGRWIKTNEDLAYFRRSRDFEVSRVWCNGWKNIAVYHHGLDVRSLDAIEDLPEGYSPQMWRHSKYLSRSLRGDQGVIRCMSCGYLRKHVLDWPENAYFQIEHRGDVLWAFDRETAVVLRDYIASNMRSRRGQRYSGFLRKVPKQFLSAKARPVLGKKLTARLHGKRVA